MWAGRNQRTQAISGSTACFNAVFTFARTRFGGYNKRTTIRYNVGARHAHLPLHRDTHCFRASVRPRAGIMAATRQFPKLLSELDLGFTKLRNRVLMGSSASPPRASHGYAVPVGADIARGHTVHTGLEDGKFDRMAAYFRERAKGGVALMVTGGIAPNRAGRVSPTAAKMTTMKEAAPHRVVTDAVHAHGGKIAMQVWWSLSWLYCWGLTPECRVQILHSGRYGYHPFNVAPSALKAPIGWFTPTELSRDDIRQTIADFVMCGMLAREAGYDGVEVCVGSLCVPTTRRAYACQCVQHGV